MWPYLTQRVLLKNFVSSIDENIKIREKIINEMEKESMSKIKQGKNILKNESNQNSKKLKNLNKNENKHETVGYLNYE